MRCAWNSAGTGDALRLEGTIESAEFLGEFVRYEIRVRDAIILADEAHRRGAERRARGDKVGLAVSPEELRLLI
jgi:iron(III) transport system ATP-binding protein